MNVFTPAQLADFDRHRAAREALENDRIARGACRRCGCDDEPIFRLDMCIGCCDEVSDGNLHGGYRGTR